MSVKMFRNPVKDSTRVPKIIVPIPIFRMVMDSTTTCTAISHHRDYSRSHQLLNTANLVLHHQLMFSPKLQNYSKTKNVFEVTKQAVVHSIHRITLNNVRGH